MIGARRDRERARVDLAVVRGEIRGWIGGSVSEVLNTCPAAGLGGIGVTRPVDSAFFALSTIVVALILPLLMSSVCAA